MDRIMFKKALHNMLIIDFILTFAFFFPLSSPSRTYAWELEKEEDGIKVFTKKVAGSDFKAYRAIMRVDAKVSSLVELIKDIESYPLWIDTCKKGVLLKKINEYEFLAYTVNNAPWPVSDRDAVVLNTVSQDPATKGSVTINIEGKHSYIPLTSGIIRVKKIKGFWRFVPEKDGLTQVIYEVHSEPGGNIPSWLLNQIVVTQPFNTLKNMKEILKLPKYHDAQQSIEEESRP